MLPEKELWEKKEDKISWKNQASPICYRKDPKGTE